MSERCLLTERDAYDLLTYLITGAEIGAVEPAFYGPRRMLDAAARLATAMAAQASDEQRIWLTTFAADARQALPLARRQPEEFEAFLQASAGRVATELKRQMGISDDRPSATRKAAPA